MTLEAALGSSRRCVGVPVVAVVLVAAGSTDKNVRFVANWDKTVATATGVRAAWHSGARGVAMQSVTVEALVPEPASAASLRALLTATCIGAFSAADATCHTAPSW